MEPTKTLPDDLLSISCKLLNDTMIGRTPQEARQIICYLYELTKDYSNMYATVQ